MKFRLTSILWLFALLAAAMAAFGPLLGIIAALFVLVVWSDILYGRKLFFTGAEWLVVLGILATLVALLIPASRVAREAARRTHCQHNLINLAKALLSYQSHRGALPAAAGPDRGSAAPVSWRIRILPSLDMQSQFSAYRRDQPWDSPNNRILATQREYLYACPSDPLLASQTPAATNYFAVVGDRAAWLPDRGRALDEFKDGPENTILLIEAIGRNAPWPKPEDLSFDEALTLLTNPPPGSTAHDHSDRPGYFYRDDVVQGLHVAFADGSVRYLKWPLSRKLATALLTIDGGETIDNREFDRVTEPQLDFGKIYAHVMFAILAIVPAHRLWRRARSGGSVNPPSV
jgi:hypothetical protein